MLFRLGLTHYLCYGSLWGQIRVGKALPWQSDVEICLKNEEIYKDEVFIARMFKSNSLNIEYTSSEGWRFILSTAAFYVYNLLSRIRF